MNTGMHDSINLGWKLSMVLKGLAPPSLLHTYESERLPNVQKLINYDKDISRLMSLQLPIGWKGDPNADPNEILGLVMEEASTFTSGLSIAFDINSLNIKGSFISSSDPAPVTPGQRGPDVQLQKPGTNEVTRLHQVTPNIARFHVVVFAGESKNTANSLKALSKALDGSKLFSNVLLPVSWVTISAITGPSAFEVLGVMPFGRVFYDSKHTAHVRYGVDTKKGGIFVLRPDGWIAIATELEADAVEELEGYFKSVLNT
jgi:phenol 2-monooxygenase